MKLSNTLGHNQDELYPIHEGKIGMYSCGPTVYREASVGNFRSFIFSDLLRRSLEFLGYEVKQVINITDVGHLTDDGNDGEDKMLVSMRREGKNAWEIAETYTRLFLRDMDRLNIKRPHVMPKATEHIQEQIDYILDLEKNGYTYHTSDGIYFDTAQLPEYGQLAGQKLEDKKEGARVEVNTEKKSPSDFALWKFSKEGENRQMEWSSPWGVGFPGWHIECSAMSERYLDSPFDIHTGGIDHIPVHHENEIAQSIGARGHKLANIWMHNAFLLVDGGKMSKSLGNTYTLDDLEERGIEPLAFRYFLLQAHYATPQNFTWEAVEASQQALYHLRDIARDLEADGKPEVGYMARFKERLEDDLDVPGAVALTWEMLKDGGLTAGQKGATLVQFDRVFGLNLADEIGKQVEIPDAVLLLLKEREEARAEKDWGASDALRDKIFEAGFVVEDGAEGQKLRERR